MCGFFALPDADPALVGEQADGFQVLKQADVLMLPFLFPDRFTDKEIRANFDYYEPRTTHQSSLSKGIYAYAAARAGRHAAAFRLLRDTVFSDLEDCYGKYRQRLACRRDGPVVARGGNARLPLKMQHRHSCLWSVTEFFRSSSPCFALRSRAVHKSVVAIEQKYETYCYR